MKEKLINLEINNQIINDNVLKNVYPKQKISINTILDQCFPLELIYIKKPYQGLLFIYSNKRIYDCDFESVLMKIQNKKQGLFEDYSPINIKNLQQSWRLKQMIIPFSKNCLKEQFSFFIGHEEIRALLLTKKDIQYV